MNKQPISESRIIVLEECFDDGSKQIRVIRNTDNPEIINKLLIALFKELGGNLNK